MADYGEEQPIFKPREMYERQLKGQYHAEAERFFDELVTTSGIDVEANRAHVKDYKKKHAVCQKAGESLNGIKAWRGFALAGAIVSVVVAVAGLIVGISSSYVGYIIMAVFAVLSILLFVLFGTTLKKKLLERQQAFSSASEEAKAALLECLKSVAALNEMMRWNMPQTVMEKATPLIDLDPYFTPERLSFMMSEFGFQPNKNPLYNVLGVTSGQIQGNPFVLVKARECQMRMKTYTGSLTIFWTETHTDSKGNVYTEQHTETLHASVQHKAPFYDEGVTLYYASEVAPNLIFHRAPQNAPYDEKGRAKFIKTRIKKLEKMENKGLADSTGFTRLGNDEFDALFYATDRNNEVEFRLLYTPLAQKNMLDLLKNEEPYGDDFYIDKEGMITMVTSRHSQTFDYERRPSSFRGYDVDAMKEGFVSYCDSFIRSLFFDLAPIISAPLYQMHKPRTYIYKDTYPTNVTSYEQESIVNGMSKDPFIPANADPSLPVMRKVIRASKRGKADEVTVLAQSYITTPRTDYVSVYGGDGDWHDVPVDWTQYDEVSEKKRAAISHIGIESDDASEQFKIRYAKYRNPFPYAKHGILGFFLSDGELYEEEEEEKGDALP